MLRIRCRINHSITAGSIVHCRGPKRRLYARHRARSWRYSSDSDMQGSCPHELRSLEEGGALSKEALWSPERGASLQHGGQAGGTSWGNRSEKKGAVGRGPQSGYQQDDRDTELSVRWTSSAIRVLLSTLRQPTGEHLERPSSLEGYPGKDAVRAPLFPSRRPIW